MPVSRSEEYYFPRDNLVIQVDDTLFRLSTTILELHSGFFRDMFTCATPSEDTQEGTSDECPLRLPADLCSAESFTTLCEIICPKVAGVFPPVLVEDFGKWELVLKATEALQMIGAQNYLLARFQDNLDDIALEPVKLLSWAMRSEAPLETLKLECYCVLAYRRRPLSEAEMSILGYKALGQVMRVRERIRLFFSNPTSVESLKSHIPTFFTCAKKSICQDIIFQQFIRNLTKYEPSSNEQGDLDIFKLMPEEFSGTRLSTGCQAQSNLNKMSSSLRNAGLDAEVRQCVLVAPPPSTES